MLYNNGEKLDQITTPKSKQTKNRLIFSILFAILIFVLLFALLLSGCKTSSRSQSSNQPVDKKTVALVNGEKITFDEFKNYKELDKKASKAFNQPVHTEKALLTQLITKKIIEQEAKRLGVKVTEKEIQDEINKRQDFYNKATPATKQNILSIIKRMGFNEKTYWTSKDLRNSIKDSLLIDKVQNQLFNRLKTQSLTTSSFVNKSETSKSSKLSNQKALPKNNTSTQTQQSISTDTVSSKFQSYVDNLVKKSTIKIFYKPRNDGAAATKKENVKSTANSGTNSKNGNINK